MAFKTPAKGKAVTDLKTTLNNARIQDENNALYQTIAGLISNAATYQGQNNERIIVLAEEIQKLQGGSSEALHPFLFLGS